MKDCESILSKLSASKMKNFLRPIRKSLIRSLNDAKNNYTSEGRRESKKYP